MVAAENVWCIAQEYDKCLSPETYSVMCSKRNINPDLCFVVQVDDCPESIYPKALELSLSLSLQWLLEKSFFS